jgi:hypothetical protein
MSLQFDQLNNQLKTNDSTNANASMVLTPAGTGSVQVSTSGSNLLIQSQSLATAGAWYNSGLTSIANNTTDVTDPLGGNTATKIVGLSSPSVTQYMNLYPMVYTFSIYLRTLSGSVSTRINTFLSASPYTTIGTSTVTVTSTWQRFSFTTSAPTSFAGYAFQIDSFGANTIYAWGAQLELGSTANTYTPTTTPTIYNAPVLSLSGVANIGLQSDGSMYVQPAGTGAIQAQATTSSATGGNARGANAVDWQTSRNAASQVAGSQFAALSGGGFNTAGGYASSVAGGLANTNVAAYGFIGGGYNNSQSSNYQGTYAVIGGGQANSALGYYNVIGGGFTNSGTLSANTAVTTQSATMNGTTAVTLSGSNASIKVGQYITGTSIGGDTYVAAISGTSLTLSKIATGSSTSTLSFYTPHGIVVGGGNNTATGSYSFIGGGGDAGNSANGNVASGAWSTVVGGRGNTSSGPSSFVGAGGTTGDNSNFGNTASGNFSAVVAGGSNFSTAEGSFIGCGFGNAANAQHSSIVGGSFGTTRSIIGNTAFPACGAPISGTQGSSQAALLVLARQTTDATPTVLASNSSAANAGNQVILPNNAAYYFRGEVVSGVTGGGNTKGWYIEGVIKRGANAASTALVGTPTVMSSYADVGAATWTIAVTADTTYGGLAVTFTGQAATTIRTVAQIRTTEMTY